MADCARRVLQRSSCVVLVGADCPAVDGAYLQQALQHLREGAQIVFGPAEDGGYVLLGLRQVPDCLFSDMPWGSPQLMQISRERMRAAGLDWVELEPRWEALQQHWPSPAQPRH